MRRFTTGLEGLAMLLPWFRVDSERFYPLPRKGWFQWGYLTSHGEPVDWYILIALPSYSMLATDFGRGVPCLHQMHLGFVEALPGHHKDDEGWRVVDLECQA